jgi:hypothetical protein
VPTDDVPTDDVPTDDVPQVVFVREHRASE